MAYRFRSPDTALTEDQLLVRKQVLHQVTWEPQTFNMGTWDTRLETPAGLANIGISMFELAACGTVRCLAGWALHFAGTDIVLLVQSLDSAAEADNFFRRAAGDAVMVAEAENDGIVQVAITVLGLTAAEYGGKGRELFFIEEEEAVTRLRALCAA